MAKNLWWMTRPTRDLHDLKDALVCFADIAEGKRWSGNRDLHKRFEMENPAKTPNSGKNKSEGSGGRTWAAWLRSWGMWHDHERVTLTDAGKLIVNTKKPTEVHKQIIHMIMTFQITSAYHDELGHDPNFKIFPFRFVLELLLDGRIRFLSTDEIALFLLQVRNQDEYGGVVSKILDWRNRIADGKSGDNLIRRLIKAHMEKYSTAQSNQPPDVDRYWRPVKDVASTLVMNISYIHELLYDNKKGIISVRMSCHKKAGELFDSYKNTPFSTLYRYSEATFMRRFGMRHDRRKASRKDTRPMTPAIKQHRKISEAIEMLGGEGNMPTGQELVKAIQEITNYPVETIRKMLLSSPELDQPQGGDSSHFKLHYLECASDGSKHMEFERLTRKIFAMMGFDTRKRKIPKTTREVDGLITNRETGMSGLLECKGGAKYTFPVGDCDKMKHTYIKNFMKTRIGGRMYSLDFFVYVVGSEVSGLGNFAEIMRDTGIRGSVIYARDLFRVYETFVAEGATAIKIWGLLKSGTHVSWNDLEHDGVGRA